MAAILENDYIDLLYINNFEGAFILYSYIQKLAMEMYVGSLFMYN